MVLAVLSIAATAFVSLPPHFCARSLTSSRTCATPFLLFRPPPLPSPKRAPQGLSEESLSAIMELVHLDVQMVYDAARREPTAALSLAVKSVERRGPLLLWVAAYNIDKAWLRLYECLSNYSSVIEATLGNGAVAELNWRRSHAEHTLARHRSRLQACLLVLRPELRQRVLQAARERPSLIPAMTTRLARSAVYRVRWKLNYWKLTTGWRSEERFRDVRAKLVENLLQQVVWLHRRIQPWTGPTTTASDVLRKYSQTTLYDYPSSSNVSPRRPLRPSPFDSVAWAMSAVTSACSQAMHVATEAVHIVRMRAVSYMPALFVLTGAVGRLVLMTQAKLLQRSTQVLSMARLGLQQARVAATHLLRGFIAGRRTVGQFGFKSI